ncbi:SWIM zinc finger domain-containing protein [Paenibacillus sp. GCM10023252]|uniref:SWIM zinc finger family protein n=1 Tax=Paenibacillus sp. GCM10023252 TaxID=3252649 RepID=UPI003614B06D
MPDLQLEEHIQSVLEQQLGSHLTGAIVERGWDYYRRGHVLSVHAADHETIVGAVRGTDVYAVAIDAGNFSYTTCTCAYIGSCKHIAAVYFAYCDQSSESEQAAQEAYLRLTGRSEKPLKGEAVQADEESSGQTHPTADASPAAWLSWMEQTHGQTWQQCRHSLHALQPVLSSLKGTAKLWEKPLQRLHWMSAILFVLEQAERAIASVDSFSRYYHEMSFLRMAEPWIQHYYTLALELEPAHMNQQEHEWVSAVIGFAKNRALRKERQLIGWEMIYLSLAEKLSESKDWLSSELSEMKRRSAHSDPDTMNQSFLHTALAVMYIVQHDDERAIEELKQTEFDKTAQLVYPQAAMRLDEHNWPIFEQWMAFLYEQLRGVRNARALEPFLLLCRQADMIQPDESWLAYMTQLLPYSYASLSDHYLERKYYEEWADLQIYLNMKPEDLNIQDVREMSKAAPRLLYPLYHQAVDAWIATRNRQGYRMAVKQLKKLEKLYKAEKNTARWEVYIAGLVRKHQRLRALQEELWKGKIII